MQKLILGCLVVLFFLNITDAIFTLYFINFRGGYELNPLMSRLISSSPVGFVLAKSFIGLGVCIALWYRQHVQGARIITYITTSYYILLNIYFALGLLLVKSGY